ncbi:acetolactate decarboxylase [Ligilactobacillus ceti]|uniref:Alpha-acetolactate decarboxylase n=1 Tax=Ligilactobacillus ceti DSM 22408 TaxID=1122146 RepID=A0A0R2KJH9_9LACO|nr:acetolactate decarboxylase [Ligilactobacillus ceti]KRN89535.1 alpha-acetolactate decarboxylase [Ligilactobacillus ceti DSM 22408]
MKDTTKLFQQGTLANLVDGLLTGTMTISELLSHGDTGIGTGEGLDGELIVAQGHPFLAQNDGTVIEVDADFTVPFATVHFASDMPALTAELTDVTFTNLKEVIANLYPYENIFYAVTLTGDFQQIKTRVVEKQYPPYPKLVEVAEKQALFTQENVRGQIIGYFSPELYNGVAASGLHLHFLADDHSIAGHLLEFVLTSGTLTIQPFKTLENNFPIDNQQFMESKLELSSLAKEIEQSEK